MLGVTSYVRPLAVRAAAEPCASAFILSIDDEEFGSGSKEDTETALKSLRAFVSEIRFKNARHPDLSLRRDPHLAPHPERDPARAARLHPHVRGHAGVRRAPHHPRGARLSRLARAAVLPRAGALRAGRFVFLALPGALGRRGVPEEPDRADVPPVLRREPAARRRVQRGRGTRPAARPLRAGRGLGAQRRAHLQRRPLLLRHQRHVDVQQDGVALLRRAGRHRGGGPQLPQVDPARDHHDRRDPGVPDADAQPLRDHRPDPGRGVPARRTSAARSRRTRSRARRRTRSRAS